MVVGTARPGRTLRHGDAPATTEDMMADHELLTPGEVAVLFRVDPKTVTRWAQAGRIPSIRTIGGHRRFRASEVQRVLEDSRDLPA
jgi:excisionase family DNA binding protein